MVRKRLYAKRTASAEYEQLDLFGLLEEEQRQADQLVWDNRDEILARASYDSELSTWTLHQLDQLKEPQPAQSLDRDRPEPDREAHAQTESTTKRRGPRL